MINRMHFDSSVNDGFTLAGPDESRVIAAYQEARHAVMSWFYGRCGDTSLSIDEPAPLKWILN